MRAAGGQKIETTRNLVFTFPVRISFPSLSVKVYFAPPALDQKNGVVRHTPFSSGSTVRPVTVSFVFAGILKVAEVAQPPLINAITNRTPRLSPNFVLN